MPLIFGNRLWERFVELVSEAKRIDIAVAWANSCDAIEALAESGSDIRAVVGTSGNSTNPTTLRRLAEFAELRIAPNDPPRIFHPKYYCFHGEQTICWVGSANLTAGGFDRNNELVHEFKLKKKGDRKWFEHLAEISKYEARYTRSQHSPQPAAPYNGVELLSWDELPSLGEIETWRQFVEGLRAYDKYYHYHKCKYRVLSETHSWRHTIYMGHKIVRLDNWKHLKKRECRILRGIVVQDDGEGIWDLLGSVRGQASYVLDNKNMADPEVDLNRKKIRDLIDPVVLADDNIADVAHKAVQQIRKVRYIKGKRKGIGPAAATRWLALARPDCLVSVNGESASGLGTASGRPQTTGALADVYCGLIAWLHDRPWFNEFNGQQPDDPLERDIWNCRAALVDVFVYGKR